MKKLSLAMAVLLAGSLTACTGNAGKDVSKEAQTGESTTAKSEDGSSGPVTITFNWWGGDSRHEATKKAVDTFMAKNPDIKVEVNFGAWTDWETARALEFQSGTAADLSQINMDWIGNYDANGDTRYATNDDGTPNFDHPLSTDGAVESTILFVLANHLHLSHQDKGAKGYSEGRWSHCHIDLHNAHLTEAIVFQNAFVGNINATGTHFTKDSSFLQCTFMSSANFLHAKFIEVVDFRYSKFKGTAIFSEAHFKDDTHFQGSTFSLVHFKDTTFTGSVDFGGHLTGNAAHFKGESHFHGATFEESANFGTTIADQERGGVTFEQATYFDDCTFMGPASFRRTTFKRLASFGNYALGEGAAFKSSATFTDSMFESANFLEVTFEGETDFSQARFLGDVNFGGSISSHAATVFMRRTHFEATYFDSRVNFEGHKSSEGTIFRMGISFNDALFKEEPNFNNVRFNRRLKQTDEIVFPHNLKLNKEGLPEGSRWVSFNSENPKESTDRCHQEHSDEQGSSNAYPEDTN